MSRLNSLQLLACLSIALASGAPSADAQTLDPNGAVMQAVYTSPDGEYEVSFGPMYTIAADELRAIPNPCDLAGVRPECDYVEGTPDATVESLTARMNEAIRKGQAQVNTAQSRPLLGPVFNVVTGPAFAAEREGTVNVSPAPPEATNFNSVEQLAGYPVYTQCVLGTHSPAGNAIGMVYGPCAKDSEVCYSQYGDARRKVTTGTWLVGHQLNWCGYPRGKITSAESMRRRDSTNQCEVVEMVFQRHVVNSGHAHRWYDGKTRCWFPGAGDIDYDYPQVGFNYYASGHWEPIYDAGYRP